MEFLVRNPIPVGIAQKLHFRIVLGWIVACNLSFVPKVSASRLREFMLRDVAFELRPGEVHALVGENARQIHTRQNHHRCYQADGLSGGGRPLHRSRPITTRLLGIVPIYQQPALFPDLSVAENMALGIERGGAWRRVRWSQPEIGPVSFERVSAPSTRTPQSAN